VVALVDVGAPVVVVAFVVDVLLAAETASALLMSAPRPVASAIDAGGGRVCLVLVAVATAVWVLIVV